jgi:hypothetical protein
MFLRLEDIIMKSANKNKKNSRKLGGTEEKYAREILDNLSKFGVTGITFGSWTITKKDDDVIEIRVHNKK